MFKKFIFLLTAAVLSTITVPTLAGRASNATCQAAIRSMDASTLRAGTAMDAARPRAVIETACAKATGDLYQLKVGLVYQLRALERMRSEEPTPYAVAGVLHLLATSEEIYSNCAGGGEYVESCTALKEIVAKLATVIRENQAAAPWGSQAI